MRSPAPSLIVPGHSRYDDLSRLGHEVERLLGGRASASEWFPGMLRKVVDDVVDTVNTRRRSYGELEKTEKTYLGTRVEILMRARMQVPKGVLDFMIGGENVDMKFTITGNWMIPQEAVGHACLLAALDEQNSRCFLGLMYADPANLTGGANRDGKKSVSAFGATQILWLLRDHPVEPNFWRTISSKLVASIFAAPTGNDKIVELFRGVTDRVISRRIVEEAAAQKDFMRRIRSDGPRGSRNRLAAEGIMLLSGTYDAALIQALGLPHCGPSDFISHKVTIAEQPICSAHGWHIAVRP
ncbi:NaeI family type II restriction endonuclease [Rhodobacter sp. 24-YEA-8]|uniref:NaeI family type II restriction endonuclease n=1 Tax=Rhodobacter sp. 24-YEA-8 TaxID=1884310 RepID=UPI00089A3861|nr:NaeI family type II restriction endonuclease [Rhodobacter sp. 24-YEA-8]SED17517.1 Restriction endonuclease NaeI [Rhodobacter sp. 24-YEA-8]